VINGGGSLMSEFEMTSNNFARATIHISLIFSVFCNLLYHSPLVYIHPDTTSNANSLPGSVEHGCRSFDKICAYYQNYPGHLLKSGNFGKLKVK